MAGTTGKGSLSFKKYDSAQSLIPALGFKKTKFKHQASAGQTVIDLSALVAPPAQVANGFVQPNLSDLLSTSILEFRNNLTLHSSLHGDLQDFDSYRVAGASKIILLFAAEEGEVFTGVIDHNPRTGFSLVDARPIVVTGILAAGDTDFNVGVPYQVGLNPSAQHGALMIVVDGQLVYRNTGNNPPGPGVDGDYYEVNGGAGLGVLIRMNSADALNDRNISALSIGALAEQPNGTQLALIENIAGQVDRIIEIVAELAGIAESEMQTAPNSVDLKAFGDRLLGAEQEIAAHNLEHKTYISQVSDLYQINNTDPENSTFLVLVNNSITLQAGEWELSGGSEAKSGGNVYSELCWGTENGDGVTISAPAFSDANMTVLANAGSTNFGSPNVPAMSITQSGSDRLDCLAPLVRVRLDGPVTIYLNLRHESNNASDSDLKVRIYAKKVAE